MRPLLLDVRGRDDLSREVEPLAKVVQTLRGELPKKPQSASCIIHRTQPPLDSAAYRVVEVAPRVPGLDVATAVERLHRLDDPKVLRLDAGVVDLEVLLGGEDTLPEEGLEVNKMSACMS